MVKVDVEDIPGRLTALISVRRGTEDRSARLAASRNKD